MACVCACRLHALTNMRRAMDIVCRRPNHERRHPGVKAKRQPGMLGILMAPIATMVITSTCIAMAAKPCTSCQDMHAPAAKSPFRNDVVAKQLLFMACCKPHMPQGHISTKATAACKQHGCCAMQMPACLPLHCRMASRPTPSPTACVPPSSLTQQLTWSFTKTARPTLLHCSTSRTCRATATSCQGRCRRQGSAACEVHLATLLDSGLEELASMLAP